MNSKVQVENNKYDNYRVVRVEADLEIVRNIRVYESQT